MKINRSLSNFPGLQYVVRHSTLQIVKERREKEKKVEREKKVEKAAVMDPAAAAPSQPARPRC